MVAVLDLIFDAFGLQLSALSNEVERYSGYINGNLVDVIAKIDNCDVVVDLLIISEEGRTTSINNITRLDVACNLIDCI